METQNTLLDVLGQLDVSQAEVARRCEMSPSLFNRKAHGFLSFSVAQLRRLAVVLTELTGEPYTLDDVATLTEQEAVAS